MTNNNSSLIRIVWEKKGDNYKREITVQTHVLGLITIVLIVAALITLYYYSGIA